MSSDVQSVDNTSLFSWESLGNAIEWVAEPLVSLYPEIKVYFGSHEAIEDPNHIGNFLAKKIKVKEPFSVYKSSQISATSAVNGHFLFAPEKIEKDQLYDLTRRMISADQHTELRQASHYISAIALSVLSCLLCQHQPPVAYLIPLTTFVVGMIAAVYFNQQETHNLDTHTAQIVGFDLARQKIAEESYGLWDSMFSPSINDRLNHLDQIEESLEQAPDTKWIDQFFLEN